MFSPLCRDLVIAKLNSRCPFNHFGPYKSIASFSADDFERKEDPVVAEHDSRYMGKLIQILPHTESFRFP